MPWQTGPATILFWLSTEEDRLTWANNVFIYGAWSETRKRKFIGFGCSWDLWLHPFAGFIKQFRPPSLPASVSCFIAFTNQRKPAIAPMIIWWLHGSIMGASKPTKWLSGKCTYTSEVLNSQWLHRRSQPPKWLFGKCINPPWLHQWSHPTKWIWTIVYFYCLLILDSLATLSSQLLRY